MKAIKVQFKKNGKRYYFSPGDLAIIDGDSVVVETVRGIEMGYAVDDIFDIEAAELVAELKPILRKATDKDINDHRKNKESEKIVMEKCALHIRKNNLVMKLLGCDYTLDRSKLIIYFEAEGRVDFRQLVKDLADEFRVRIELRQVGSRDGAKFIGGLGPCGLIMCCVTHIGEFDNVSIKMAKNQNLSLNPQKISGTCGKLLCCIKYENETYTELRKTAPDVGDIVKDERGEAKVLSSDVLNRQLKIKYIKEDVVVYCNVDDVTCVRKKKQNNDDDLKDLKGLE